MSLLLVTGLVSSVRAVGQQAGCVGRQAPAMPALHTGWYAVAVV